jgi:glycosyltransferase involved in cell wall biosynthesis
MRVLTFLHSFEPGGVERVALRLVRRWREVGVEAPLFIGRDECALRDELAAGLDFSAPGIDSWSARFETVWMILKLPAEIRRVRSDLLFCAGNTYSVVAVLMKMMLGKNCPPVMAKISNDLVLPNLSPSMRFLYGRWAWLQARLIDGWVVMHPAMRGDVEATIGDVALSVIPDPAVTMTQLALLQRWRPRPDSGGGRRFVAMGRLVRQKNYPLMLKAFAAGAGPDDRLMIFGDGPERDGLEALTRTLGLDGRIHFAGHVAESAEALVDQDVLLLSSRYEGIPAALVEAMACGMPIVATDCDDGVRGLLERCSHARLVQEHDAAAFGAAIRVARHDKADRPTDQFDAADFTIEAGANAYLDAFSKTLRGIAAHGDVQVAGNNGLVPTGLASANIAALIGSNRDAA